MAQTVILSHETVCSLLEAHASMAAWYYRLTDALRAAGGSAEPPDGAQRKAYLAQLASHFPEIAGVAQSITEPRAYVPPPAFATAPAPSQVPPVAEAPAAVEPAATAQVPPPLVTPSSPEASTTDDGLAPPPLVDPDKVRYD